MSNKQNGPVAPRRAVFADVPARDPDVPAWMQTSTRPARANLATEVLPPSERPRRIDITVETQKGSAPPPGGLPGGDPLPPRPIPGGTRDSNRPPRDEAFDEREEALRAAMLSELESALALFEEQKRAFFEEAENKLLQLTKLVAERVIERELDSDHDLLIRLVSEGLSTLQSRGQTLVTIGRGFEDSREALSRHLEEGQISAQVVVDPRATEFACRLRAELGEVDESLENRLDLAMAALEIDGE